ncbi:MAG: hypothetical protein CVU98_10295 [Firmicutes bacterium HGW-Firmicutes-3]|nr:MAG: hypothetical protein CVU98_10295 [Firmicutes bacterium HGW-Firmicutes-3]
MKQLGTFIGSMISGVLVFAVWGQLASGYGLLGGWFAALVVIGLAWSLCHYVGVIDNKDGAAWVDLGLPVGVAGTALGVFNGVPLSHALPTLGILAVGAIFGGFAAAMVTDSKATEQED